MQSTVPVYPGLEVMNMLPRERIEVVLLWRLSERAVFTIII